MKNMSGFPVGVNILLELTMDTKSYVAMLKKSIESVVGIQYTSEYYIDFILNSGIMCVQHFWSTTIMVQQFCLEN